MLHHLKHIGRLYRTIRHLKAKQLYYQLFYRISKRLQKVPEGYSALLLWQSKKNSWADEADHKEKQARFRFLNLEKDFGTPEAIDWNFAQHGKLWTYNLNYFDYIRRNAPEHVLQKSAPIAQLLIDDWIRKALTLIDAHEPYPTSLRIMNWLGFYAECQLPVPDHVHQALRIQYDDLWTKLEYHLLGNHLLENAIALVRAATYFEDLDRISRACQLLQQELKEQYRPEGAHYELSGAYHCTLLGRLLELYAALVAATQLAQPSTSLATFYPIPQGRALVQLQKSLEKQLGWLQYFTDQNGYYPHLNDSVDGIAPAPNLLLTQARELELSPTELPHDLIPAHYHASSGPLNLWLDIGPIGPDYIPGHAHADSLTFCLNFGGRPLIIDPAISTYEANATRLEERETAYHNTVSYQGQDSSEIWAAFRCGRRATTRVLEYREGFVKASHDGYLHLGKTHQRQWQWRANELIIKDTFPGKATAYFHFSPDLNPHFDGDNIMAGPAKISWALNAYPGQFNRGELQPYECALGFNQRQTAWRLAIGFVDKLEVRFLFKV